MREELIINGQYCDLDEGTSITLEYVSNLLNEPGKISLSHSYTIKLPRTANNARILDLPELPAHESSMVRRYLPVHYYRNGINLIGDNAHAYLTSATDEQYELVIIWDDIPELRALAESDDTINDLPDLPVMSPWLGSKWGNESNGAVFARYQSSVYPVDYDLELTTSHAHPSMRVTNLFQRILTQAGVAYSLPSDMTDDLVVLAAPDHKPNAQMIAQSGVDINRVGMTHGVDGEGNSVGLILTYDYRKGWMASNIQYGYDRFICSTGTLRLFLNLRTTTQASREIDYSRAVFEILYADSPTSMFNDVIYEVPFEPNADGSYRVQLNEDIGVTKDGALFFRFAGFEMGKVTGIVLDKFPNESIATPMAIFAAETPGKPLISVAFVSTNISLLHENAFPLEGNLPDMKQWEFLTAAAAIMGLFPTVVGKRIEWMRYSAMLDIKRAQDWTSRLMTDTALIKPAVDSAWAQINRISYTEDDTEGPLGFEAAAAIVINDSTLKSEREWSKLPFAASRFDIARHYERKGTGDDISYETIGIKPRIFKYNSDKKSLQFTPDLYGEGLKAKYATLQAALEKPVIIEATARLTEIDLATLDLTRPVYLAQYGQYYHVLKVQTSENDMCKVELLQLKSR